MDFQRPLLLANRGTSSAIGGVTGLGSGVATALAINTGSTGAVALVDGVLGTVQSLSGAGAVNTTTLSTEVTSTGVADALSLANGTAGQIKIIVHGVDGGSAVLTPTTKTGFSTITFTNVGESVTLQYFTTRGWMIVSLYGAVAG